MKAVLMSIQPKWCELIASGKKTVEVRKTKPKLEVPFKVYIYETKDKHYENIGVCGWKEDGTGYVFENHCGKVIGEFVCDKIDKIFQCNSGWVQEHACISREEYFKYLGLPYNSHFDSNGAYAWHISNLIIYDKPRELSEFYTLKKCHSCDSGYESTACIYDEDCRVPKAITRPPQSWCYCERSESDE